MSVGKRIVLETLCSTLSALVGLFSTSDLGMGWYSLASHLTRRVRSHHKCYRL